MAEYIRQRNVKFKFTNCPSHVNQPLLKQALDFYAAILMPKLRRQINIEIQFTYAKAFKSNAEVEISNTDGPPNDFKIIVKGRLKGWVVFLSVGHEMVHIKQWAMREMRCYKTDDYVNWHGRIEKWNDEGMAYWDLPWELEALSLEFGLYNKFKHHYGLKGLDLKALC